MPNILLTTRKFMRRQSSKDFYGTQRSMGRKRRTRRLAASELQRDFKVLRLPGTCRASMIRPAKVRTSTARFCGSRAKEVALVDSARVCRLCRSQHFDRVAGGIGPSCAKVPGNATIRCSPARFSNSAQTIPRHPAARRDWRDP